QMQAARSWVSPLLDSVLGCSQPGSLTADGLKSHLQAIRARQQLVRMNERLIPSLCPETDEASQFRYPQEAYRGLQEADHLCALARPHPWVNTLLDALLSPQPTADLNHHVRALEVSLQRYQLVQAMLASLGRLGSYLQSAGLAGAYQSIKAGQSIQSWA